MEHQLYQTVLLVAGILNLMMTIVLHHNSYAFKGYDVYRRARLLTGFALAVFGVGFLMHWYFQ